MISRYRFLCLVQGLGLAISALAAQAGPSSTDAGRLRVLPCGSASQLARPATTISFEGHDYLIASAGQAGEGKYIPLCSSLSSQPLKLIARDDLLALSVFEAPSGTSPYALAVQYASPYVPTLVEGQTVTISTGQSQRHTFGAGLNLLEVSTPRGAGLEFLRNAGAPLLNGNSLLGILSDESVILLPGQPAKSFRERDLRLIDRIPFGSYRLAFGPKTLATWLARVTAPGWSPELVLEAQTANADGTATTRWHLAAGGPLTVEEKCFNAAATGKDDGNYPVGGVEPFGVGGLDDVLSNCQLREVRPEGSRRIELAFRAKSQGGFEIKSLWNVQSLLELRRQGTWRFLVEASPIDAGQGAALVRSAADLRRATIDFYQQQGGNPLVLRNLFFLSSLLMSADWREVRTADLTAAKDSVETDLPLYLGADTDRVTDSDSDFARAKADLSRKLDQVLRDRGALP